MPDQGTPQSIRKEPHSDSSVQAPFDSGGDQPKPPKPAEKSTFTRIEDTKQLERDIRTGERWLIGVGVATVVVNIIIAAIYYGQLGQMRISTDAAKKSADTADATLREIQRGGTDTHTLAQSTTDVAKNGGTEASAMKDLVRQQIATNKLQARIARQQLGSAIIEPTPWLGFYHDGDRVWVQIAVWNSKGSTPASNIRVAAQIRIRGSIPEYPNDYHFNKFLSFPRDYLPAHQDGIQLSTTLAPGEDISTYSPKIYLDTRIAPHEYASYASQIMYVWGLIRYRDYFGEADDVPFCRFIPAADIFSSHPGERGGTGLTNQDCSKKQQQTQQH